MNLLCSLSQLRQRRLQLLHPLELGARELAPQPPRAQVQQQLLAGPLVERLAGGAGVELGAQRHELLGLLPALDQKRAEAAVQLRVEVIGGQLGQERHERRVEHARCEDPPLELLALLEHRRRELDRRRACAVRRLRPQPDERLPRQVERVRDQPQRVLALR